jgi:hypothetical protein
MSKMGQLHHDTAPERAESAEADAAYLKTVVKCYHVEVVALRAENAALKVQVASLQAENAKPRIERPGRPAYRCPRCGAVNHSHEDVASHYCRDCDRFDGTDEV